jgi:hypothetical protein
MWTFPSLLTIVQDEEEKEEDPKNILLPIHITQPWEKRGEDRGCTMPGKPFGYKIKYVNPRSGYTAKRPMYEIKPGVWVSRAAVPENIELNWHHSNKWNNSEYGYIMNLYSSAHKEFKSGRRGKKIPFDFTKETWWQHWLKQKTEYGMKCPYSKVTMTTSRGRGRGTSGGKNTPTNISKDQIWPGRGYTPMNLIFCTVKFNHDKKGITPDGCEAVTDVHNQRMNNWVQQTIVKRNV